MATVEVIKSELDLFKRVSFQKSIEHSYFIEYRPNNPITEGNSIEFILPASPDEYTDLQNCYLQIKGKLTKQNGTEYPASDDTRFSLIPYPLFTIWDQISIYLGQTLISQASNTQSYIAYIDATLENTPNKIKTFLRSAGYITPFGKDDYNCDNVDIEFSKFFKQSKQFSFYGRFNGSIFNSDKLLLNGLEMRIILNRAPNKFTCMGRAADNDTIPHKEATEPKIILTEVAMYVRRAKISKSILNAHEKTLQSVSRALYPIKSPL